MNQLGRNLSKKSMSKIIASKGKNNSKYLVQSNTSAAKKEREREVTGEKARPEPSEIVSPVKYLFPAHFEQKNHYHTISE